MYAVGVDGLLLRLELIGEAHSSLDLQYYAFHGDESGTLITDALGMAAARGVRVRVLVDDGETRPGDEQLFALAGQKNVEIRIFNPWRYRGHNAFLRDIEYLFSRGRLDFRMHNKLLIADRAVALVGGRNIGDEYFQVDPEWQFADDDVFTAGPQDADVDRSHPKAFVNDSVITTKIKTKLAADHVSSLAKIRVDTDADGVVWLSGSAHSKDEIKRAVEIARNTEGVRGVHSALIVKPDD